MLQVSVPRSILPRVVLWASLAAHVLGATPALAQSERDAPLLANERNLLVDTQARLLGIRRPYRELDAKLLDTTYDDPAEDLLLDVNAMFEENLQHELERSPDIQRAAATIGEYVTKHIGIPSLAAPGEPGRYRAARLGWICAPARLDCASGYLPSLTEDGVKGYDDKAWRDAIASHCAAWREPDTRKDCGGYAKLLKMLYTQLPYFGGSTEYKDGKLDLEYWLYHLSTITKDPGRAQPPGSNSPKPILDYVTPDGSYLPVNNPRNLGLGITDGPKDGMSWDYIPQSLRGRIFFGLPRAFQDGERKVPATLEATKAYWDDLDDSGRKHIYGDVLRIPWSYAHLAAAEDPSAAIANVAGVRGNVLLTPEVARPLYVRDYAKVAPTEDKPINFGGDRQKSLKDAADEFVQKHMDWYTNTRKGNLPIIGGMSGHTLGYLNLYIAALTNGGADTWAELPSLERCRAVLLAGLIGDKRHHSYAEVMSASHAFAYPWTGSRAPETLAHATRTNYHDLWASKDKLIRDLATTALVHTSDEITTEPPTQSVLAMLDLWATANRKTTVALRGALFDYLKASITDATGTDSAAKAEKVKQEVKNLLSR